MGLRNKLTILSQIKIMADIFDGNAYLFSIVLKHATVYAKYADLRIPIDWLKIIRQFFSI